MSTQPMMADASGGWRAALTGRRLALAYCLVMLVVFAALSWSATSGKCATSDEPVHALSGYASLRYGDYRPEPDHPPLWKQWAALPWLAWPPAGVHLEDPVVRRELSFIGGHWPWVFRTMYRTPGNDPVGLVARSRAMMLPIAVALGGAIGWAAWRMAGPLAACVAVTLYALDPNLLAHGCLVKNDVLLALVLTVLGYVLWRCGEGVGWGRAVVLGVLCGAAVNAKLTGVVAGPVLATVLAIRAMMPGPWPVLGRVLTTRGKRLAGAAGVSVFCAAVAYGSMWGAYGFRHDPTPDPALHFSRAEIGTEIAVFEARARGVTPEGMQEAIDAWRPSRAVRAVLFAWDRRLLPEALCEGVLHGYANSRYRVSYLLGRISNGSGWAYFPVAFLAKTPLATLAATLLAAARGVYLYVARGRPAETAAPASHVTSWWMWMCLSVPAVAFGLSAVLSNVHIGLRHIFPVYPFLFIAVAVVAARLCAARPRVVRLVGGVLLIGLAVETGCAYPDYISFFNAAAGGARGGFRILGDSNLDWGQDLPLLKKWQEANPDRKLSLAYFGTVDPGVYGIRYENLLGGDALRNVSPSRGDGVIAVSATVLQGIWGPGDSSEVLATLRGAEPTDVLGGSIYLFDLNGK